MASDNLTKGAEMRRRLLGDAFVDAVAAPEDPTEREVQALVSEFNYGAIWSRPGLDIVTRTLITIALFASQNRIEQVKQHTRASLHVGATRQQIREAVVHVFPYSGIAACVQGLRAVNDVFREIDRETKDK